MNPRLPKPCVVDGCLYDRYRDEHYFCRRHFGALPAEMRQGIMAAYQVRKTRPGLVALLRKANKWLRLNGRTT